MKLIKKESKIDGFGMFTIKLIPKGTEYYQIPLDITYSKPQPKCALIKDKYVSDDKVLNWVNHSCDPNSKLDKDKPSLIAIKDILPDEEITVDYNQTEEGNKINCTCKSENCKGYFIRVQHLLQ
jgi:uncharacterized protein